MDPNNLPDFSNGNFRALRLAHADFHRVFGKTGHDADRIRQAWQSFKRITSLNISSNRLSTIPGFIRELTNLQELDASENNLSGLWPSVLADLDQLRVLRLRDCDLGYEGPPHENENIDGYPECLLPPNPIIHTLDIAANDLKELPPTVLELDLLETLDLSRNRISDLPTETANLTALIDLNLSHNALTHLPSPILHLGQLQNLLLSHNQIESLPVEFSRMVDLQVVDISENRLRELPSVKSLTSLHTLKLSGNKLIGLPEMGGTSSLRNLDVSNNQIVSLPESIGHLKFLETLDISNNHLKSLPTSLAPLLEQGLQVTGIESNPGLSELANLTTRSLISYLRSLSERVESYEGKVLVVGEGEVGKTCLVSSLQLAPFISGLPSTHGIEITILEIKHPHLETAMKLNLWDFGGQEVYRVTHQFFFTTQALYLLVWNSRKNAQQCDVDGWLRRIRLRAGSAAPTILVATHSERFPELNFEELQADNPRQIRGLYAVENSSGSGIPALREKLAHEAALLPVMGKPLAPRWLTARDTILAAAVENPQISFTEFSNICTREGLGETETEALASLMNELGQIVHFNDDDSLHDVIVLDPEWLARAISRVLEDPSTRASNGILDHNRLRNIWSHAQDNQMFPRRFHPYLLRLMEKFEISYRLEGSEGLSLIAQCVTTRRPVDMWQHDDSPKIGQKILHITCELSDVPPGLISWLTVRWHQDSVGIHWRDGLYLRHHNAAYDSEALVDLNPKKKSQLRLTVRAPSPDLYFNALRDGIEHLIVRRWPGMTFTHYVPCNHKGDGKRCSGRFKLETLLKFREARRQAIDCQECLHRPSVSELLTGFPAAADSTEERLAIIEKVLDRTLAQTTLAADYAADAANAGRRALRALSEEVTDCPRIFTLTEIEHSKFSPGAIFSNRLRLALWCEEPDSWHVHEDATYEIDDPKQWLRKLAPYLQLTIRMLKIAVPIGKDLMGLFLTEQQERASKHELELAKTLADKIAVPGLVKDQGALTRQKLDGADLRVFRVLLFQLDPSHFFGGLRRLTAPTGEVFWVCPEHAKKNDPGLPTIAN